MVRVSLIVLPMEKLVININMPLRVLVNELLLTWLKGP